MAMGERARFVCLFVASAAVCIAHGDPRAEVVEWADRYAAVYQVPSELVHSIIEVESAWNPRAVSTKGAVGVMQLMPATALTFGVTNRFDLEQNIRGGVAYLARLLGLFDGDLRLVAAAYLTGENRILRVGLGYAHADVYQYVSKVVRLYREKCSKRLHGKVSAENRPEGGSPP